MLARMTRFKRSLLWALVLAAAGIAAYGRGLPLHLAAARRAGVARPAGRRRHPPRRRAGKTVSLADNQGKVSLVYFGYTRCADTCPLTMQKLAKDYRDAGAPADVQVATITVDPSHDTPAVPTPWVKHFDPSFIGSSGSAEQIAAAAKAFMIGYSTNGEPSDDTAVVEVVGRDCTSATSTGRETS